MAQGQRRNREVEAASILNLLANIGEKVSGVVGPTARAGGQALRRGVEAQVGVQDLLLELIKQSAGKPVRGKVPAPVAGAVGIGGEVVKKAKEVRPEVSEERVPESQELITPPSSVQLFDESQMEAREAIKKAVIKRQVDEANQLMDAGIAPEAVLQEIAKDQEQASLATEQQVGFGSPVAKPAQAVGKVLADLLTLGGVLQPPAASQLALEQARTLRQEREIGLTAAERERIQTAGIFDLQKELAKTGTVDALTPENAGKFNLLLEGSNAVQEAGEIFLQDPRNLSGLIVQNKIAPGFIKSQTGRILESAIERMIQARTRIETGAALQPSELKSTKKRFLPRVGDSPETARQRMKPLFDFFEGSLRVADPTGTHRQRAMSGSQEVGIEMVDAQGNRALVDPQTNQVIREL